jgi:hypothetical protein
MDVPGGIAAGAERPASWRELFAGAGLFLLLPAWGLYTAIYALLGGQGQRSSPTIALLVTRSVQPLRKLAMDI